MFELIQVSEKTYYINSPSKIGLYKLNNNDICLIDNRNDKDAGRKINKLILVGNNKKAHFLVMRPKSWTLNWNEISFQFCFIK